MRRKIEKSLRTDRRRHLYGSRGNGHGRMKGKANLKGKVEHSKCEIN